VERLMTLLNALKQDIEIVIRAKPRSRVAVRIGVVAARNRLGSPLPAGVLVQSSWH
jgi:hypothetical protein